MVLPYLTSKWTVKIATSAPGCTLVVEIWKLISQGPCTFILLNFIVSLFYFHKNTIMSTIFGDNFLNEKQKEGIRSYKYRGGDLSLMYKYVLSPMAQYFVDHFTPETLAPNMITLIGMSFNVFATIMTLIYDPELNNAPYWLPILTGCCLFIYQTLDNMDGKQARKIGASSPLGLLFDHGCDAICAGMSAIPLSSVFGSGWNATNLFTCWISGFITFYAQTWEEYYMHEMWLPIINGPSEGLIILCSSCILSAYKGANWWQKANTSLQFHSYMAPLFPFQLIIGQVLLIIIPCIIPQIYKVLNFLYHEQGISHGTRLDNMRRALTGLGMCSTFVISTFLWCFISKSALSRDGRFPVCIYLIFTFYEVATHLMLSHTTGSRVSNGFGRLPAWLAPILPLNSFYGNYNNVYLKMKTYLNTEHIIHFFTVSNQDCDFGTDLPFTLTPFVNEILLIQILSFISFIYIIIKTYRIIISIANALDVYVFLLGKPSQSNSKLDSSSSSSKKSKRSSSPAKEKKSTTPTSNGKSIRSRSRSKSAKKSR